jgi:hypothetical protein
VHSRRHSYHSQAENASSILATRSTAENRCNRCGSTDPNRGARCSGPSRLSAGGNVFTPSPQRTPFGFRLRSAFRIACPRLGLTALPLVSSHGGPHRSKGWPATDPSPVSNRGGTGRWDEYGRCRRRDRTGVDRYGYVDGHGCCTRFVGSIGAKFSWMFAQCAWPRSACECGMATILS